jgi:hypothetical protein
VNGHHHVAAVVDHDLAHDRQAQAGSVLLGRDVGVEDALARRRGHAGAVVVDHDVDAATVVVDATVGLDVQHDLGDAARALGRLHGVLD